MTVTPRRWDIFCRVVDNFGDAGVSWRLARQLVTAHGCEVTLWLDQLSALARMAPDVIPDRAVQQTHGVTVRAWTTPMPTVGLADVVVEAFGCGLPENYLAAMAERATPPAWFVLEYLSAEPWVEQTHGLGSRHPRLPLSRRFWLPGFTARTGGLLRERGLLARRDAFRADPAAQARLWALVGTPRPAPEEFAISLFCYPNPRLPALLDAWADGERGIVCLVAEGVATGALDAWTRGDVPHPGGAPLVRGCLRLHVVPFVAQDDYDRLLWSCDVNFVRGEDSLVRAQWAARPLVWHIYPQADDAHRIKLDAYLDRYLAGVEGNAGTATRRFIEAWNAEVHGVHFAAAWRSFAAACPALQRHGEAWARQLAALPDLAAGLVKAATAEV